MNVRRTELTCKLVGNSLDLLLNLHDERSRMNKGQAVTDRDEEGGGSGSDIATALVADRADGEDALRTVQQLDKYILATFTQQ